MANWTFVTSITPDADQAARKAVFDKIAPAGNWKLPIDTWIDSADLDECNQAAIWFVGSALTVVQIDSGRVRVTAPGYYATIGA